MSDPQCHLQHRLVGDSRLAKVLFLLAVVSGSVWLMYLVDDGLGLGWVHAVLRNWQETGLLTCKGKLVFNPGGYEVVIHPQVYPGMSPVGLYLVYGSSWLFDWTGQGVMAFHVLLALGVLWGVGRLFDRERFAFWLGAVVVLCPGYQRFQKFLDPNTVAVLLAIPYAAFLLSVLRGALHDWRRYTALVLVTLAYISLNWTTSWVFGPLALLLLGVPGVNRRTVLWFLGFAGVSCGLFAVFSGLSRAGGRPAGASVGIWQFILGYTWGSGGYGTGLGAGKAFVRLAFVNIVALLPLLLVCAYFARRGLIYQWRIRWVVPAPACLAVLEVVVMRNYFGHHPWMASPLLLLGLVWSLALLCARTGEPDPAESPGRWWALVVGVTICFGYGLLVLMFARANSANDLAMRELVRRYTNRSDSVALVKSADPQLFALADRLSENLDRHLIAVEDFRDLPATEGGILLLSATVTNDSWRLVAQFSAGQVFLASWGRGLADWFNRNVARREPGDRLQWADTYYLYARKRIPGDPL